MAELLIDITRLLSRGLQGKLPTGVDRVALAYIEHFRGKSCGLVRFGRRWLVLNAADSQRLFEALLTRPANFPWLVRFCVARNYLLNWKSRAPARLLNTSHSGLDDPSYARKLRAYGWKGIFFLHDLIPITHPEYCRSGEKEKHAQRLATMLAAGQGVIVNSNATLRALRAFAGAGPLPPCLIAPLAPAQLPAPAAVRPLAEPYFVMLGTIEPRKNHLLLLHLWRQLVEEMGAAAPRLVIIGQRGWECEQVTDLLDRCEALRGAVTELPRCDDKTLTSWLHHARALLFPSFEEGFGIPAAEALMLGLPVIASDLPVFREFAGDIPTYLDPLDGPGWKRAILDYMPEDSAQRQAQCARMQGFIAPTWKDHFALVDDFLNRLDLAS